jgi:hypothetical protein
MVGSAAQGEQQHKGGGRAWAPQQYTRGRR